MRSYDIPAFECWRWSDWSSAHFRVLLCTTAVTRAAVKSGTFYHSGTNLPEFFSNTGHQTRMMTQHYFELQSMSNISIWKVQIIVSPMSDYSSVTIVAPCRLRGCKNRPALFPGRMTYEVTKPGSLCLLFFFSVFIVLLTKVPFCIVLFCVILCSVSWLFLLGCQYRCKWWLERLVSEMAYNMLMRTLNPTHSLTHSVHLHPISHHSVQFGGWCHMCC